MEPRTCAIIGHPPARFRFKYKETNSGCKRLKKRMRDQFISLYRQGVRRFYVGGCVGVDQWAGEILLHMREQPEFHELALVVVTPFPNHDTHWDGRSRGRLQFLLSHSAEHIIAGTSPGRRSFSARNRYLIDHADVLVAIYDNNRSIHTGTGQTVFYAERLGIPVIFIHPDTGIISVIGSSPKETNQFLLVDFPVLPCDPHPPEGRVD